MDFRSNKPRLSLEIRDSERLSLTLPYLIEFSIARSQDGIDGRSVILRWSPAVDGFGASGLRILRHTAHGLEKVDVDHSGLLNIQDDGPILVNGYNQSLWEIPPGGKVTFAATFPERYQKQLISGERYDLIWPGGHIPIWEWGTVKDHMNEELAPRLSEENWLTLPEGPRISFTAEMEVDRWPKREEREAAVGFTMANLEEQRWRLSQHRSQSPPPVQPSERDPEAPILSVELECPPTVHRGDIFEIKVKVTYESDRPRPIIFHTYPLEGWSGPREGFRLYRRRSNEWEECEIDEGTGFMIVDDLDVSVNVSEDSNFVSLKPGESWVTTRRLQDETWTELPDDATAGDVFRYTFKGVEALDWWDWGSSEDHRQTVVKLPCWIAGDVVDPPDNGRRPKLVVPASKPVEFSFIG